MVGPAVGLAPDFGPGPARTKARLGDATSERAGVPRLAARRFQRPAAHPNPHRSTDAVAGAPLGESILQKSVRRPDVASLPPALWYLTLAVKPHPAARQSAPRRIEAPGFRLRSRRRSVSSARHHRRRVSRSPQSGRGGQRKGSWLGYLHKSPLIGLGTSFTAARRAHFLYIPQRPLSVSFSKPTTVTRSKRATGVVSLQCSVAGKKNKIIGIILHRFIVSSYHRPTSRHHTRADEARGIIFLTPWHGVEKVAANPGERSGRR